LPDRTPRSRGELDGAERDISFLSGATALEGSARIPSGARGIAVFAHGSGSGRHSPRNRQVAAVLNEAGLATLLIDLLSADEERLDHATGELRFDVGFLAERLLSATDRVAADEESARFRSVTSARAPAQPRRSSPLPRGRRRPSSSRAAAAPTSRRRSSTGSIRRRF
jgi:hypothetical protein